LNLRTYFKLYEARTESLFATKHADSSTLYPLHPLDLATSETKGESRDIFGKW